MTTNKRDFTWLSVLLTIVALVFLWNQEGQKVGAVQKKPCLRRVLRFTPTWEIEKDDPTISQQTRRPNLWSLIDNGERTIVLRIWYGPENFSEKDALRLLEEISDRDNEVFSITISFEDIYKSIIFVVFAWALGSISEQIGIPSLVGEIVTGFLLGPPLTDFVPYAESWVLIGNIGLIGMILESGVDIDVGQLKETGLRAICMAFTGTSLPLLTGLGLGKLADQDWRSAIAVGAAFAPSSLGVAGNALSAGGVLNTPIGQMIVASSVVDDVLGLILLSILEVFVNDDAKAFDYILPFISSFGYLMVLGYSGVTWMPRLIENKLLPRIRVEYREFVAFVLMFALLLAYMPLLNYSKASYLTGTFLAGLTFSQINSVHASFVNKGRQLLNWLLRIFFAATIGFQVPIKKFHDLYVLRWGATFILPILCKLPLGLFVPRFQKDVPDDFPYDPYLRDVLITSLAMTCRGEFNFIIASFALGEGLFDAYLYSAVVFAVLLSSIVTPPMLLRLARYYNGKSKSFVAGNHPITRIGNTCDGYRPLYVGIQARTPIHWGLQNTFKKALESNGLIIVDHRSWHTLGPDSVDITEIFAQDTVVKVKVPYCFGDPESLVGTTVGGENTTVLAPTILCSDGVTEDNDQYQKREDTSESTSSSDTTEKQVIEERCNKIRTALLGCLGSAEEEDYNFQVTQWTPHTVFENNKSDQTAKAQYCLQSNVSDANDHNELHDELTTHDVPPPPPTHTLRRPSRAQRLTSASTRSLYSDHDEAVHHEPQLARSDLWDTDSVAQAAACHGFTMAPVAHGYDVVEGGERHEAGIGSPQGSRRNSLVGSPQSGARRKSSAYDSANVSPFGQSNVGPDLIKERLHGYVRD